MNQDLRGIIEYISGGRFKKKGYLKYTLSVSTIITNIPRKQSYTFNRNMIPCIVLAQLDPCQPHFPLEKPPENYDLTRKPSDWWSGFYNTTFYIVKEFLLGPYLLHFRE